MFGKEILFSGVRLGCLKSLRIHEQPWSAGWKLSQFSGHLCPQMWDTVSESVGKLMTTLQTCSIQEMEIMCMKIPPLGSVCSSAVQGWNSKSVPSLCAALFCPCSDLLSHFQPQYCLVKIQDYSHSVREAIWLRSCSAVHVMLQQLICFSSNSEFLSH